MLGKAIVLVFLYFTIFAKGSNELLLNNFNSIILNKIVNGFSKQTDDISSDCLQQIELYKNSIVNNEEWALKMLDATSKLQSGIFVGNFYDLGNFDECLSIEGNENEGHIFGQYCLGSIDFNFTSSKKLLKRPKIGRFSSEFQTRTDDISGFDTKLGWAACVPNKCSAEDIQKFFSGFDERLIFSFTENQCQSKETMPEFGVGAHITSIFFLIIFIVVVLSTIYELYLNYYGKKTIHEVCLAFSALTNGRKLFQTTTNSNQLLCLNGLRAISIMWVIIGHGYEIPLSVPVANYLDVYNWSHDTKNMFILGSSVSVDTFFLVGGLLTSYTFMGAMKKGIKFKIPMYYLHRYIRLTPALAAAIPIHAFLLEHIGSGPVYPTVINSNLVDFCKTNWWSSLLYIQNYYNNLGMCVPQSWYLAVDMQMFLISPLLLIPLKKWPKHTIIGIIVLTIASIAITFGITWHFEISRLVIGNTPKQDEDHRYYYYVGTHTRLPPYTIGIILGYYIYKAKQNSENFTLNKIYNIIMWAISLAILCACVFSGQNLFVGDYDRVAHSISLALVRPAWSIGLCWVIYSCVFGYGGPINWFLSLPIFQIVGKLTYSLYIVHYAIVMMKYASAKQPVRFGNVDQMYNFWGDFGFSFALAIIWSLMFESPMIVIEKIIFGSGKKEAKDETKN